MSAASHPDFLGEPVSSQEFNTNNAWGFGGGIGTEYVYACGVRRRKGTAYFRHLRPGRFDNYRDADGCSISLDQAKAIAERHATSFIRHNECEESKI